MALTRYKLGELIQQLSDTNYKLQYGIDDVKGISTEKEFIETKANMEGVNLTSYKIVNINEFAYVADTSRRGDKIALAYNRYSNKILISSIYTVFKVKKTDLLLSDYLFIYFNRPEFDRYSRFNSWGSARETFSWEDFCDIDITLPSLEIQQKYVNVYKAMLKNQKAYEKGLEDLKLCFETLINEYKHKAEKKTVGSILKEIDCRNIDGSIKDIQGINITKQFMTSISDTHNVNFLNYKIVKKGQFAFSGMQTGRDKCIRIALFDKEEPVIISPAYTVFEIKEFNILPEYIMMWFYRKEVDRLGWFMSDASIRTNLDIDRFYEIKIPIPPLEVQKSIVNIYNVYNTRRALNEKLKVKIKALCPVLIKGSIEEGEKI